MDFPSLIQFQNFTRHERSLGEQIFDAGNAELVLLTDWEAHALVQGTREYEVRVYGYFTPVQFRSFCTCPAWTAKRPCKHVYATLLAIEEVFVAACATSVDGATGIQATAMDHVGAPNPSRSAASASDHAARLGASFGVSTRTSGEHWRDRLARLRGESPTDTATLPRIEYRVRPPSLGFDDTMLVEVFARTFRKSTGDHGSPNQQPIPLSVLPRLAEPDRTLLHLYDQEANTTWRIWEDRKSISIRSAWHVQSGWIPAVLELLARTGQAYLAGPSESSRPRLVVDIDEPYRLRVERENGDSSEEPREAAPDGASSGLSTSRPEDDEGSKGFVTMRGVLHRGDDDILPIPEVPRLSTSGLVWLDDRVVRVDLDGAETLAQELTRGPLRIPAESFEEALATLLGLPGADHVLAEEIASLPQGDPTGLVQISMAPVSKTDRSGSEGRPTSVEAELQFDYGAATVDRETPEGGLPRVVSRSGPAAIVVAQGGSPEPDDRVGTDDGGPAQRIGLWRRNPDAESALLERAKTAGLEVLGDVPESGSGTSSEPTGGPSDPPRLACALDQLAVIVKRLITDGFTVLAEGHRIRPFEQGSARVRSTIDWFELEGEIDFTGRQATLPELLRGQVDDSGFVQLGDGSVGILPETWLRRLRELQALASETDDDVLRVPRTRALLLDAMLASREVEFRADRELAGLRRRLAKFERLQPTDPHATRFRGELRNYQKTGLAWLGFLREFGLGGCLADDMGLGKTVQVLAHLASTTAKRRKAGRRPSLLVAPRSVLTNWLREAERFTPRMRVLDFSRPDRWETAVDVLDDQDLILTTYGLLRSDITDFVDAGFRFDTVILDEAQAIKNPRGQTAKSARLLIADHRIALTGTPVENHLGELWSLFEFLNPGMLGHLESFRATVSTRAEGSDGPGPEREMLQRALRPVLLRRTKSEVLTDLPPKIDQVLWCELGAQQRRRYNELKNHYRKELLTSDKGSEGDGIGNDQRFHVLEALLRLRQAACHEGLLQAATKTRSKRKPKPGKSAKFDTVLPQVRTLVDEGHKILLFSQFTALLDLLEPELESNGLGFARLDGGTRRRDVQIERFRTDPDCPVFLISLKAGGVGLNLIEADYVFVLDPWWNPAVEAQAIDRAHRIGQEQTVHAYRVLCRDTVEERVLELQESKKQLVESILGNDRSLLQDLTREDLELLLG